MSCVHSQLTVSLTPKDSMVMELLSSSKRIADIYSFCALSSVIEYAPIQIEKEVMSTRRNIDQPLKKLEMAIELLKVVATIHGHKVVLLVLQIYKLVNSAEVEMDL